MGILLWIIFGALAGWGAPKHNSQLVSHRSLLSKHGRLRCFHQNPRDYSEVHRLSGHTIRGSGWLSSKSRIKVQL